MAKTKTPNVKRESYTTSLKVPLTTEEVAERADHAARILNQRDEKENELKAHQKNAKGQIEAMDAEMRRLSDEVRTKTTYRPVDCERIYDYAAGTYTEVRLDTGAEIDKRRLNAAEMQRELPFAHDGAMNGE